MCPGFLRCLGQRKAPAHVFAGRLQDYARFDLRLSPEGNFYFLEANTTPSLETAEALALSARWAGLDYPDLIQTILTAVRRRYLGNLVNMRKGHGNDETDERYGA